MSSAGECPGKVWGAAVPFRPPGRELCLTPWWPAGPSAAAVGRGMREVPSLPSLSRQRRPVASGCPPQHRSDGAGRYVPPSPRRKHREVARAHPAAGPSGSTAPGATTGAPFPLPPGTFGLGAVRAPRAHGRLRSVSPLRRRSERIASRGAEAATERPPGRRWVSGLSLRLTSKRCRSLSASKPRLCFQLYLPRSGWYWLEPSR